MLDKVKISIRDRAGNTTKVYRRDLAKKENGLPWSTHCYQDQPDGQGIWEPDFSKVLEVEKIPAHWFWPGINRLRRQILTV